MFRKIFLILLILFASLMGYVWYLFSDPSIPVQEKEILLENIQKENFVQKEYLKHIPVVYIQKNGYEAGLQHGVAIKEEIQEVVSILKQEILQTQTTKGKLIQAYLLYEAKQLDACIPQKYREEMRGVADGANVSYNDILLINTYDDLLHLSGCSSLAVTKSDRSESFIHA